MQGYTEVDVNGCQVRKDHAAAAERSELGVPREVQLG